MGEPTRCTHRKSWQIEYERAAPDGCPMCLAERLATVEKERESLDKWVGKATLKIAALMKKLEKAEAVCRAIDEGKLTYSQPVSKALAVWKTP